MPLFSPRLPQPKHSEPTGSMRSGKCSPNTTAPAPTPPSHPQSNPPFLHLFFKPKIFWYAHVESIRGQHHSGPSRECYAMSSELCQSQYGNAFQSRLCPPRGSWAIFKVMAAIAVSYRCLSPNGLLNTFPDMMLVSPFGLGGKFRKL